jgi:hypothetical protein
LALLPGYSWLQDDVLNWLQPAIAAINQYACCKNTYFVEKRWKDEMDTCMLCHEEIPKMHKIPWGTSKNAQNDMRNFQIWTKSHEDLPEMHKIPWLTSNNAQNPTRNFQNVHNPMKNSQICTKSYKELPKMPKISRGTSKTAQNHTRNFQKCTKLDEELPNMHKI